MNDVQEMHIRNAINQLRQALGQDVEATIPPSYGGPEDELVPSIPKRDLSGIQFEPGLEPPPFRPRKKRKDRLVKPSLDRVMHFACGAMTTALLVMALSEGIGAEPVLAFGYLFSAGAIAVLGLFAR